jgi:hypothetical protein
MSENVFCGPLEISLNAPQGALGEKRIETFELYDVAWDSPRRLETLRENKMAQAIYL